MLYSFAVTETSYGTVEVEADNFEEAFEKAYDEYASGNVNWGNIDVHIEADE